MLYMFGPDRFERAAAARGRYGLYFVRGVSVLMVIGQLIMDATRSSWKTASGWGVFCSGWRYERRDPCLIPFIQAGPPPVSAQRWWFTLLLVALIVWWVRRLDLDERRIWAFFTAMVMGCSLVVGFVWMSEHPDRFQVPGWWIALWILWPFSLVVYSVTARPSHPFLR